MVHVGRLRYVAQGAETSSRGWWMAGADDVQVGGVLRWESRWIAGARYR